MCLCICVAMKTDKHSEEAASGAGSGRNVVGCCSDELCSAIFFITKVDKDGQVFSCVSMKRMNTEIFRWAD